MDMTSGDKDCIGIDEICRRAREASRWTATLGTTEKNRLLGCVGTALIDNMDYILGENAKDVEAAKAGGMKPALVDRLVLTKDRIEGMVEGLGQVVSLDDPIGEVTSMKKRPNGLKIGSMVVPLGVVAIIYEARPNVTVDAFGLCFKAGNACILRGGSNAILSNGAIARVIREAVANGGGNPDCIQLVEDTSHESVNRLMRMNGYVDVIIPRGGAGLIRNVVENSTVPVIETGTGNCHIYVDEYADIGMAVDIINNAKTQRVGVCNACESLLVHSGVLDTALPLIVDRLKESNVEVRGDERARAVDSRIVPASEDDWGREYLDYIISVKTVDSIDEAIEHINHYNTGHSEAIITGNYANSQHFLEAVDAAAVYVNASTRFTDGFEFGFGAEIGISTQKLHARGPMGLKALTTTKYVIYGEGQIRG
jgi:glutamate-5-semialdehyde dehydrogenase